VLPSRIMSYENIKVIAYSGYRGDESPRAFFINDEKITVVEIVDMWIEESLSNQVGVAAEGFASALLNILQI
jgi:hypothetical protein